MNRVGLTACFLSLVVFVTNAWSVTLREDDPFKLLSKREFQDRLLGVELIVANGHKKAEEMLLKACKDRDWEVALQAVRGLAKVGSGKSVKVLVDLAIESPLAKMRLAAATSAQALDATEAGKLLTKKLKGEESLRVAEALAVVGARLAEDQLFKMVKAADSNARRAAFIALRSLESNKTSAAFENGLDDENLTVRATAMKSLAGTGNLSALSPLMATYFKAKRNDSFERFGIEVINTFLGELAESDRQQAVEQILTSLFNAESGNETVQAMLLVHSFVDVTPAILTDESQAMSVLAEVGLAHEEPGVRAIAAVLLAAVDDEGIHAKIDELSMGDPDVNVRYQALQAIAVRPQSMSAAKITERLQNDESAMIREEAAVLCKELRSKDCGEALTAALQDADWQVAVAAAVSLGSLQHPDSIEPLQGLLTHNDWRLRAAGVVGLGWLGRQPVVDILIEALRDKDPVVKSCAHAHLKAITSGDEKPESSRWKKWWEKNQDKYRFTDLQDGPSDPRYASNYLSKPFIFMNDVIVLTGANDRLDKLLSELDIEYRLTQLGKVIESDLHPGAVFMANCPGQINDEDVERLTWFLHAGGYIMAGCRASTNTVGRVAPGLLGAHKQGQNPGGIVAVQPLQTRSPFLEDVFLSEKPNYHLPGYQLLKPLDHARVEVLVDSLQSAARWGSGNLACWFPVGHGVVLASTSHFALNGMQGLRFEDEKERQAYAIEHLGYDFEQIRELTKDGAFKKDSTAVDACEDLSILRLVARFCYVKHNRLFR